MKKQAKPVNPKSKAKTNKPQLTDQDLLDAIDKGCAHAWKNAEELCKRKGVQIRDFLKVKLDEVEKALGEKVEKKIETTLERTVREAEEASESIRQRLKSIPDMPSIGVKITKKQCHDAIVKGCEMSARIIKHIVEDNGDIRSTPIQRKQTVVTDIRQIASFLRNETPDLEGRLFSDIKDCSDEEMERCHSQIQQIFPLHENSNYAEHFPLVTKELIELVKDDTLVKHNLASAADRMKQFYCIGPYYNASVIKEWAQPYNHNLLRITRIIRSLRLFRLWDESRNFYFNVLEAVNKTHCSDNPEFKKSLTYWAKAFGEDPWDTLKG